MANDGPNLECRMYESRYPEVNTAVMIQVTAISETGAYVSLLEYNNIEGMILSSELSRHRMRSVNSVIKVGRIEPAMVLRVDKEKGHIDLSKRRVSEEEKQACEERFNKSKLVHSILRHVAETLNLDLEGLCKDICWPLYRRYGHAFEGFKLMGNDPDTVLDKEVSNPEIKEALVKNIRRRITSQVVKIRAYVELKCFQFDGVLHIKEAMRKAEAAGNDECLVKIKVVAAPLYVLTTQTLDKEEGILTLNKAIEACAEAIEHRKGKLTVKEGPRAVSERDDKLLAEHMAKLCQDNEEMSADEDSEVDEEDRDQ